MLRHIIWCRSHWNITMRAFMNIVCVSHMSYAQCKQSNALWCVDGSWFQRSLGRRCAYDGSIQYRQRQKCRATRDSNIGPIVRSSFAQPATKCSTHWDSKQRKRYISMTAYFQKFSTLWARTIKQCERLYAEKNAALTIRINKIEHSRCRWRIVLPESVNDDIRQMIVN